MAIQNEEEVRAALATWSRERVTRRDASKLAFESMENKGPMQLVLTSVFERRGVTYELSPAPRRTRRAEYAGPWKHKFEFSEGDQAPVGSKLTRRLDDVAVHMGCDNCSDTGEMRCSRCDGDGRVERHIGSASPCGRCRGTGHLTCDACDGSGALYGKPTLWAAVESTSPNRLLEAEDLPNSVYIALREAPMDGHVVHRQEGATIAELSGYSHPGAGAYRQAPTESTEASVVRDLCANAEVPGDVRLLRQRLEIRRVDVWRIKSRQVRPFWVLGDPIQVLPPNVLRSFVVPIAWLALCIFFLVALTAFAHYLS